MAWPAAACVSRGPGPSGSPRGPTAIHDPQVRAPPRAVVRLRPFELENWLEAHEMRARHLIGHSGVAAAPVHMLPFPDPGAADWGYGEFPQAPELAHAIARRYGVPDDEVLATVGGSEADLLACLATVERDAPVAVESPTYFPLAEVPRILGARVDRLVRNPADGFRFPIGAGVDALRKGARLIVLSNPNNPTGATTTAAELRELASEADRRDAWILVDEIFHEITRTPPPSARTLHPRIIATNSLTKAYGLPGLRTGWLLAPPEIMATARQGKALTTLSNPVLDQRMALAALTKADVFLGRACDIRDANLATLNAALASTEFTTAVPDAGVSLAVKVPGGDDVGYATRAMNEAGILLVPGTYLDLPGYLRVGIGSEPATFATAVAAWMAWHREA